MLLGANLPMETSGPMPSNGAALGAFAEYNSGQGRYVPATWTSSDDSVVAVVDNMLVARQRGAATLTAAFEGLSDTEAFSVAPGFFGRWSGTAVVEQCTGTTGSMQDVLCRPPSGARSGLAAVGLTLPFAIEIPDTSSEDITARVTLGSGNGTLAGKNRGGGYFSVLGEIIAPGNRIRFIEWNARAAGDAMEGVAAYEIRIDGVSGVGAVAVRLSNVTRR